jgi:hypothetical protein
MEDALRQYAESLYEPLQSLTKALSDPVVTAAYGLGTYVSPQAGKGGYDPSGWAAHDHGHGRGRRSKDCCTCRTCEKDDCHCRCCIVDADLVVHARLGERRVVPIVIENDRRREREITLELSSFTSKGGRDTNITGEILGSAEFTVAPCAEKEIVIGIEVVEEQERDKTDRDRRLDVDECEVAYADLRVVGCDIRPIRIAVAVLPRDCHAYRVDCGCGCC